MPSTNQAPTPLELTNSVDLLQHRAKQVADRSLQSTNRMVGLVDESKEVGVRTLISLHDQGEKLNMLDAANNELREEIRESEAALTDMEKCCGLFALPWKLQKSRESNKAWRKSKAEEVVSHQPEKVSTDYFPDGIVPRITNDACENAMEDNLSHVHSTVRDLKGLAATMRDETRAQNHHLDRLAVQAETNDARIQAAALRTDRLHQK